MSDNFSNIDELIKSEEDIISAYSDLEQRAVQDNVKLFLDSFANGHREILTLLQKQTKKHSTKERLPTGYINIHATDHLRSWRNVDLGNLQSVLMFITKSENESFREFENLTGSIKGAKASSLINHVKSEKSTLVAKADRLYYDLIESKVS